MTATAPIPTPIGTTESREATTEESHDPAILPRLVEITPWVDPLVDRRGHDARSSYVEQFWLGTLGPTATWLIRRLVAGFDEFPDGYHLDLLTTARSMGLSFTKGPNGPFSRALGRCVMFGVAHRHAEGYAVRRRLPEVARRHLLRLPDEVQVAHQRWVGATRKMETLARGRTLATAMLAAGDDAELLEPQLVALGIAPPTAAEVMEIVRREPAVGGPARREELSG
ncbi:hypothetical protein BH24ACT5_BH24ACT5_26340 [soil metagenome]